MTSDSHTPELDSNSVAAEADSMLSLENAESKAIEQDNSDDVIPASELSSVLLYLNNNSASAPGESVSQVSDQDDMLNINLESPRAENPVTNHIQVQFKTEGEKLLIILPSEAQLPASEVAWFDIWQQLKLRLRGSDRLRTLKISVHLIAQDRLLDVRQLQELAEALEETQMQLKSVATSRRQTAIAAVTCGYSVEQLQPENYFNPLPNTSKTLADALYLEMTVRSGIEIRHPGTVVILGDVNPGGIVVADGDILVWGRLRGVAHAGAAGNRQCLIMALQMEPTQLRIADAVARAPEKSPLQLFPEVAHITPAGIRIAKAADFSRKQFTTMNEGSFTA